MAPPEDEVMQWLRKAESDLLSAKVLTGHDTPIFDTAAFHCQQAAEKSLKAFLIHQKVSFARVHDLTYLLDLCEAEEASLETLRSAAILLTPFAVETRYPGDLVELTPEEADNLLSAAEDVWIRILTLLSEKVANNFRERSNQ